MTAKTNDTISSMTFGNYFIAGAYGARTGPRPKRLARFAVNAQSVEFQGPGRLVISSMNTYHSVLIPSDSSQSDPSSVFSVPARLSEPPKTLLVVDDDPIVRKAETQEQGCCD